MENIDPVYMLQPLVVILIAALIVVYFWFKKRTFTTSVLLYSFLAYFLAISAKSAVQSVVRYFGIQTNSLVVLGVYFGLQTALFEVGLAYLFARYAVGKSLIGVRQAGPFGAGLAFWENGILLGALSLMNIIVLYVLLGSGGATATTEYNNLIASSPSLFYSMAQALPWVALGILERISSILAHFSWGYLCVASVYLKKLRYLLVALPMGFLPDFLVPFAGALAIYVFEAVIFVLALVFLLYVIVLDRNIKQNQPGVPQSADPATTKTRTQNL